MNLYAWDKLQERMKRRRYNNYANNGYHLLKYFYTQPTFKLFLYLLFTLIFATTQWRRILSYLLYRWVIWGKIKTFITLGLTQTMNPKPICKWVKLVVNTMRKTQKNIKYTLRIESTFTVEILIFYMIFFPLIQS